MVFAFLAFGVLTGAGAAVYTLMSGGSVLLALLAYSGAGVLGTLAIILVTMVLTSLHQRDDAWVEDDQQKSPLSA